ncbi:MBL fold metallo-hydrolase [Lentisphaerota bacterium WC36G]|nr:MBL fold metallo-hydrolase [Lentisphaerae bacterium WC36]
MKRFSVEQLLVGGFDHNFSYVVANFAAKTGFVIDPCGSAVMIKNAIDKFYKENEIKISTILVTHGHHDHTEKVAEISQYLAKLNGCKTTVILGKEAKLQVANVNMIFAEDQHEFKDLGFKVLATPGHTNDAVCFLLDDDSAVFTGDTLFVDDIGYCNAKRMYDSLRNKLWNLPNQCIIYSGHNYGHIKACSIELAKKLNLFFAASQKSLAEFKKQLQNLI